MEKVKLNLLRTVSARKPLMIVSFSTSADSSYKSETVAKAVTYAKSGKTGTFPLKMCQISKLVTLFLFLCHNAIFRH